MTRNWIVGACLVLGGVTSMPPEAAAPVATVTVRNGLDLARPAETIVVLADSLRQRLGVDDLRLVRVRDDRLGRELVTQAVDTNDDGAWDELVFQVDLDAGETKMLSLRVGERRVLTRADFKAQGRFVRERRDDFAWENDRVAHRMYGAALETWAQEPLTSSGIDVWVKRTRRLVISDWYLVDDYHRDTGEGADLYSAGRTRGCGGNGPWVGGRLAPSPNFRSTRVLANGPIRVTFELGYEPWDADGVTLSEVKRVTLDAGHHMNRFESRYTIHGKPRELQHAAGVKRSPATAAAVRRDLGVLRTWEAFRDDNGHLGCAVVMDPSVIVDVPEPNANHLFVARVDPKGTAVYHAGSAWDRGGDIADVAAWDRYLDAFARRSRAPVEVEVASGVSP